MVRLEILGGLRLVENGVSKELASGGRLLAYLALHAPNVVDRRKCALDLYPEEDYEVSGNRIRVALTRFKKILGNGLLTDGRSLQLYEDGLTVDYWDACRDIQVISDCIDACDELDGLKRALPILIRPLLPNVTDNWVTPWSKDWSELCLKSLGRLLNLSIETRDWDTALHGCQAAFVHAEGDVYFWRIFLNVSFHLGFLEKSINDLKRIREDGEQLTSDVYNELLAYANKLKSEKGDVNSRWSDDELRLLGRTLARAIEEKPADALSFFLSDGALGEFMRDQSLFLPFFEAVLESGDISGTQEIDLRLKMIDIFGILYDQQRVLEEIDILRHLDLNPVQQIRVCFSSSFALFQRRDYDEAIEAISRGMEIAKEIGDQIRYANCQTTLASIHTHMGNYDKALELYWETEREFLLLNVSFARSNVVIVRSNILLTYCFRGEWELGVQAIKRFFEAYANEPTERALRIFYPLAGCALIKSGDTKVGIDYLVDGLKLSYRSGSYRVMQLALDYSAAPLAHLGFQGEALGVLEWVNAWRHRTQHLRSMGEREYVSRILGECVGVGSFLFDPDESPKRVIAFVIRLLREFDQGLIGSDV